MAKKLKREVLGDTPIEDFSNMDVFDNIRLSYANFVDRLPQIIATNSSSKEINIDGNIYTLEVSDIKVDADISTGKLDKKKCNRTVRECIDAGKTLTYNVNGTVRFFKNGVLVDSWNKTLFEIPALTDTASFYINGKEKAFKFEYDSSNLTHKGCGEKLIELFENCEIISYDELRRVAFSKTPARDFRFGICQKQLAGFYESDSMLLVNGINIVAEAANKTAVTVLETEGMIARYTGADVPFLSSRQKKEGNVQKENAHITLGSIIVNGISYFAAHPVKDGIIQKEVKYLSERDLLSLRDKDGNPTLPRGVKIGTPSEPGQKASGATMKLHWKPDTGEGGFAPQTFNYDGETGQIDIIIGDAEKDGYPDYVPVSPTFYMSIVDAVGSIFSNNINETRNSMEDSHKSQYVPFENPDIPFVGNPAEDALVRATNAALFAENSGVVQEVNEHEIVVQNDNGTISNYVLDEVIVSNSTTDKRFKPIIKAGERIEQGDPIADSACTKGGEFCFGKNAVVMTVSYTAKKTVGLYGAKGARTGASNNNDGLLISESFAKQCSRKGIYQITYDLRDYGWGSTALEIPVDEDGNKDERFDEKTKLPKKGAKFKKDDVLLKALIPDSVNQSGGLANFANFSANTKEQDVLLEKIIDGTVEEVTFVNGRVNVYLSYTRALSVGDKFTLGSGQKGTITGIIADEDMPKYIDEEGKEQIPDLLADPISLVKRGAVGLGIKGNLMMALKKLKRYVKVSPDEKNLFKLATNLAHEAKIPLNGMYKFKDSPNKVQVGLYYVSLIKEAVNQRMNAQERNGSIEMVDSQDRMGTTIQKIIKESLTHSSNKAQKIQTLEKAGLIVGVKIRE